MLWGSLGLAVVSKQLSEHPGNCKAAGVVCGAIPPCPPNPSSCYCLCCVFRTDRRFFFFLITFNQCKKKKKKWAGYPLAWLRNSAAWLAAAVLLPLSTKLSQLWYAVFSPSPLTFVEIADGSKFCSSLEKDLSSFSLPTPIFFILTTSLTKTSKSGVPKGILKEASCIFS